MPMYLHILVPIPFHASVPHTRTTVFVEHYCIRRNEWPTDDSHYRERSGLG